MTAPVRLFASLALSLAAFAAAAPEAGADTPFITVQSTTSTQNSGLYEAILPLYEAQSGVDVRVVAVGTGRALSNAEAGDGDVVIVHARAAEDAFVAAGWGIERMDLMYNDFVIVGPKDDPAGIRDAGSVDDALRAIMDSGAAFASRGDDSGTHKKELALWASAGRDPTGDSGSWYRETGSGMGATLNLAIGMGAYTMSDRATWIAFGNKADHVILYQGEPPLQNQYGVILVNPERHANVKAKDARAFRDWLISDQGQAAIAAYRVDGQQLFFPNAPRAPE